MINYTYDEKVLVQHTVASVYGYISDLKDDDVLAFRPPMKYERFLMPMSKTVAVANGDFSSSDPRLILKPKPKRYSIIVEENENEIGGPARFSLHENGGSYTIYNNLTKSNSLKVIDIKEITND